MAEYLAIENPMTGSTYHHPELWGVYAYDTYPRGSVLEGRERRRLLDSFESEAAARRAYPRATVAGGTGFHEPNDRQAPPWFDLTAIGEQWDDD